MQIPDTIGLLFNVGESGIAVWDRVERRIVRRLPLDFASHNLALDPEGRPSFNLLQNYGSAGAPLHFFVFDVLVLKGHDVMGEPLVKRRQCSRSMSCGN